MRKPECSTVEVRKDGFAHKVEFSGWIDKQLIEFLHQFAESQPNFTFEMACQFAFITGILNLKERFSNNGKQ